MVIDGRWQDGNGDGCLRPLNRDKLIRDAYSG